MVNSKLQEKLKKLPQIGNLLEKPELRELSEKYSHSLVKHCCAQAIDECRQAILENNVASLEEAGIVSAVEAKIDNFLHPRMRRVLNATGILLHTGLGRSPLLDEVYQKAFERVRAVCNLELDLESGKRGDRQNNLEDLLCFVSGAECAAVVNNNAAAVLIALNTLANRKETIVARGQLIEIGGSFRLPEVIRKSGTRLVEVGTTNRTYLRDYEDAITLKTKAVLVAHTSNYRVKGFVHEEEIGKIATLCGEKGIHLIHDLGGGVIYDLKNWDLPHEPVVSDSVKAGAHVITFSGDKILGGPQCGIIVGKKEPLWSIRKNPLMRALRPDKLTLALLEETLKLYLSPKSLLKHHPVLARLTESDVEAESRAQYVLNKILENKLPGSVHIEAVPTKSQLGSGALPLEEFPSAALKIRIKGVPASKLAREFRLADPAIIGYTSRENVYLDLKAIMEEEIELFARTTIDTILRISV